MQKAIQPRNYGTVLFRQRRTMSCAVGHLKKTRYLRSIDLPHQSPYLKHCYAPPRGCHAFSHGHGPPDHGHDPRLVDLGRVIKDEFAVIREEYASPKHPIVLAHGLLGFNELRLAGPYLPGIEYWRGVREALSLKGIDVVTAVVPPSGSIEERAKELEKYIAVGAHGKDVNIIAHSMGGLDARYMTSRLRPQRFKVLSLTTIATPHRGSSVADYIFDQIGDERLPQIYRLLDRLKIETGAFAQLTRKYMEGEFNPKTPDVEDVRYFSYGAAAKPGFWSVFRPSHRILQQIEGPNDGLVSIASSKWGTYKGTLVGVSHLDLINWTNRLKWLVGEITGNRQKSGDIRSNSTPLHSILTLQTCSLRKVCESRETEILMPSKGIF